MNERTYYEALDIALAIVGMEITDVTEEAINEWSDSDTYEWIEAWGYEWNGQEWVRVDEEAG